MTILLTTHDMEEADALCGTLAIMHRGVIAAQGSPAQLKAGIGPSATLDEVFALYGGGSVDAGGNYRDIRDARSTAQRLG
jgi:ABC-2 type transport system ATP-binding protein